MTTEQNHAEQNAQGHMESIMDLYNEWNFSDVAEGAEDGQRSREDIEEEGRKCALSVEVRSDWYTPGASKEDSATTEYKILLTTGGPALRLIGSLDQYGQPDSVRMEYQDWGTLWTEYRTDSDQDAALEWFASLFYFGE